MNYYITNNNYCYKVYKNNSKQRISLSKLKKKYNPSFINPGFIKDNIIPKKYNPNKNTPSAILYSSNKRPS